MRARRRGRLVASVLCTLVLGTMLIVPAAGSAAEPGPYVYSVTPAVNGQTALVPVKVGVNPNFRQLTLQVVVDDPDGVSSLSTARTLRLVQPNGTAATVTTTFAYVAGTGERRATITAVHQTLTLPEGVYTATVTSQDKSGASTTYTWSFYAGLTTPVVTATTPSVGGVAATPGSAITCNIAGPRSAITGATMRIDGAVVPAVLTASSNLVNTLSWAPSAPLNQGVHTAQVTATNASGLANTYLWVFYVTANQPGFVLTSPPDGSDVTPGPDGTVALTALACDRDGIDPATVRLEVQPGGVTVVPTLTSRAANGYAVWDLYASIPVSGRSGAFTVAARGSDVLGNAATAPSWTFVLPATDPPIVDSPTPADGAVSATKGVRLSARMRDYGPGLDLSSVALYLDGVPLPGVRTEPVADGVIAYAYVDLADNRTYRARAYVENNGGLPATLDWDFSVAAPPTASALSPALSSTYRYEDVPVRVRFAEPVDRIDESSLSLTFDGRPVPSRDIFVTVLDGGHTLDVTARVRNVGGVGSITHTVVATVADTTRAEGRASWSFDVVPQTGQADIAIDENGPCLASECHAIPATDIAAWNRVHWTVGDARGWGIPSTGAPHKYNCNICHYSVAGPGGTYTPAPLHVQGLYPCQMCHAVPRANPIPVGVHGGTAALADFSFLDHDDGTRYDPSSPHAGEGEPRDCLYCHQGPKGSQEIENYANGTVSRAHDIVGDHRVGYPDDTCQMCHSAVLTREHAYDRNEDGLLPAAHCVTCHESDRPEVRDAVDHAYPALRFRYWGTDTSPYLTNPTPGASIETTAFYEIPGELIVGGNIRIMSSTLGTIFVDGYSGGSWTPVYSATMGGLLGDLNPGGNGSPKAFPKYAETPEGESFSCDPVERIRIRYVPIAAGRWHYVSVNVDGFLIENPVISTCEDCHGPRPEGHGYDPAMHTAEVGADLDASGFTCGDCHGMSVLAEHSRVSASTSANAPVCVTCHPTPRDTMDAWGKTCQQAGCHATGSATERHGGSGTAHALSAESAICAESGCHDDGDLTAIHLLAVEDTKTSCLVCHSATEHPASGVCFSSCHADKVDGEGAVIDHGYDEAAHTARSNQMYGGTWGWAPGDSAIYNPAYAYDTPCTGCHDVRLLSEHDKPTSSSSPATCRTCHPTPRNSFAAWDKTCSQGGCHAQNSEFEKHVGMTDIHRSSSRVERDAGCSTTWTNAGVVVYPCHYPDIVHEHNRRIWARVASDGTPIIWRDLSVPCVDCHSSDQFAALANTWDGSCLACHPASHAVTGSARNVAVYASHNNMHEGQVQPFQDAAGTRVGSNAIDVHGPKPVRTTASKSGCSTIYCHNTGYLKPGYTPLGGTRSVQCSDCHGTNVLLEPPPVVGYGAYSLFGSGMYPHAQYEATYGTVTITRSMGVLPAGSRLTMATRFRTGPFIDYARIAVSANGSTWTWLTPANEASPVLAPLYMDGGGYIYGDTMGAWLNPVFNLPAAVNNGSNPVFLRVIYLNREDAGAGIWIDNIKAGTPGSEQFTEDFESGPLSPTWTNIGWFRYAN